MGAETNDIQSAPTPPASTSLTTADTSTAAPESTMPIAVSVEFAAALAAILAEWNSGDADRWRATFADNVVAVFSGSEYDIDEDRDGYEFFSVLGARFELIGCSPVEGTVGEAAICEISLPGALDAHNGVTAKGTYLIEVVDGRIVHYDGHNVDHFEANRRFWHDFVEWVAVENTDDAAAIRSFPGTSLTAAIALPYLDQYPGPGSP